MTNEPTTGEIVRAFRGAGVYGITTALELRIIDRLESQERELSGFSGKLEKLREFHERYAEQTSKKYVDDILALTARAEQAETELDRIGREYASSVGKLVATTFRAEQAERERDAADHYLKENKKFLPYIKAKGIRGVLKIEAFDPLGKCVMVTDVIDGLIHHIPVMYEDIVEWSGEEK